jgi:hypothetical protein
MRTLFSVNQTLIQHCTGILYGFVLDIPINVDAEKSGLVV